MYVRMYACPRYTLCVYYVLNAREVFSSPKLQLLGFLHRNVPV